MSTETTNPEQEVIDTELSSDETSEDLQEEDSSLDESEEIEEELEDWEHEGKQYKVPKALKPNLMMQADYTRKTQELANQRREIEAQREAIYREAQEQQEEIQAHARLHYIGDRLQQYEQVNWREFADTDPVSAQKAWFEFSQLKEEADAVKNYLGHRSQVKQIESQRDYVKRIEEGNAVLSKDIPNWGDDLKRQLVEFAKQDGWSDGEIAKITAGQVKTLYKRFVGESVIKKASKPKEEAKPVTTVKGSGYSGKKNPSQMTDAEFATWRRNQIKNRGK